MLEETADEVDQPSQARGQRLRRMLRRSLLIVAALVIVFHAGLGWIFSSKIHDDALVVEAPGGPDYEVEVLAADDGTVELSLASGNHHLDEPGIRGVAWPGGYGQVGEIVELSDDSVTRTYIPIEGTPTVGERLDMDGFAYPVDPSAAHGLEFTNITYPGELGPIEAWFVDGTSDDWVVVVHGKTAPRREALRLLPVLNRAGYDVLMIDYRNDVGAPQDPSGFYQYGVTEWRDIEGAVGYAVDRGASSIAVVGFSMGGGIASSFLTRSPLAAKVDAAVLDSPMLDFSATIDLGAANSSLPVVGLPIPQSLTAVAKLLASWRFDVDWSQADYLNDMIDPGYATPTLVIHGTEDERTPLSSSRELAVARPDVVRLEVFEHAGHMLSWNVDPERYETAVIEFLGDALG